MRIASRIVGAACLFALARLGSATEPVGPAQLIGTWRGTSFCTDRVVAPACKDEPVVYEFTAGAEPGTAHWKADKVVTGDRIAGTGRLLPGKQTIRRIDVRKDPPHP